VDVRREGRRLPFEIWYPAGREYAGQDLQAATQDDFTVMAGTPPQRQAAVRDAAAASEGSYPLILFSHTSAGHRRQSSFLCTHLASHGYVVAALDHLGNTVQDATERAASGKVFSPAERDVCIERIIADRVPDLRLLLDQLAAGAGGEVSHQIDPERIGVIGWSFGGWAALAFPEVDERCGAVVAMASGGNSKPLPGIIPSTLTFAWNRDVATLLLAAENDQYTPLPGQYELYERAPRGKRMFILSNADHGHFGDVIEDQQGCSTEDAHTFTRGLVLGHLDAALKGSTAAQQFMARDAAKELQERGVGAVEYRPMSTTATTLDPSALAVIARTPAVLRALLADLPTDLIERPNDEGWSLKDIVAHLVDAEGIAFSERISRMLAEERPTISSIDPPARLREGGYAVRTADDLLDELERQRREHVPWLSGLTPQQLARSGQHDQVGEIHPIDIAHQWAAHDMAHLRQIALMIQQHLAPLMGATREFYDV
jgi:dienelactone hydrolase